MQDKLQHINRATLSAKNIYLLLTWTALFHSGDKIFLSVSCSYRKWQISKSNRTFLTGVEISGIFFPTELFSVQAFYFYPTLILHLSQWKADDLKKEELSIICWIFLHFFKAWTSTEFYSLRTKMFRKMVFFENIAKWKSYHSFKVKRDADSILPKSGQVILAIVAVGMEVFLHSWKKVNWLDCSIDFLLQESIQNICMYR